MQPAVYRVTHQRFALSGIRLGLAVLGFAGSIVAGADTRRGGCRPRPRGRDLRPRARHRPALAPPRQADGGAAAGRRGPGAADASGCERAPAEHGGVAVLAAASLAFQPILAALLAGILAGMGIVGLVSCVEVALWERRDGLHLYADAVVHTRRYLASASSDAANTDAGQSAK